MSQAVAFRFDELVVRTYAVESGEPWFNAADVCAVLGYRNPSKTIHDHCRPRGITKRYTPTDSGSQEMTFINEGNLYRLIIKSRKPEAERFEAWVCDEVLPSIRKNGGYASTGAEQPLSGGNVRIPTAEYLSLLKQSAEMWRMKHRAALVDNKEAVIIALMEHGPTLSTCEIASVAGAEAYEVAFVQAARYASKVVK